MCQPFQDIRFLLLPKKCQFDRDQGGMWKILVSKPFILESGRKSTACIGLQFAFISNWYIVHCKTVKCAFKYKKAIANFMVLVGFADEIF